MLDDVKVSKNDDNGFKRTKEKDLSRHLKNGDAEDDEDNNNDSKDEKDKLVLAKDDYALYEALNLLKGISLVKEIQQ